MNVSAWSAGQGQEDATFSFQQSIRGKQEPPGPRPPSAQQGLSLQPGRVRGEMPIYQLLSSALLKVFWHPKNRHAHGHVLAWLGNQ